MMRVKKAISLILAAVMLCVAAVGCTVVKTGSSAPENGQQNFEDILTLNGEKVPQNLFKYYYCNIKADAEQQLASIIQTGYDGDAEKFWADDPEDLAVVKENTLSQLKAHYAIRALAQENGIEVNIEEIDEILKTQIANYENEEAYQEALKESFLDEETYRSVVEAIYLQQQLVQKLFEGDSELYAGDEEVTNYINENYVRAKHILVLTDGITDEAELAEKKKLADELLGRVNAGEDFDALMNEYSEDTGLAGYPNGYYFTKGEMVEEFENATYALKENEVSDIVATSYGYHIIKRLPFEDDFISTNLETFRNNIHGTRWSEKAQAAIDAVQVEYGTDWEAVNYSTGIDYAPAESSSSAPESSSSEADGSSSEADGGSSSSKAE